MNHPQKQKLILEGLNCAGCAAKIESTIKQMQGIQNASLNFATRSLTFEANESEDLKTVIAQIAATVQRIEPDVVISSDENPFEQDPALNNKKTIIQIVIGTVFFLLALLFRFSEGLEFFFFFLSYLILGKKVLEKAARNILKGQVFDENFLMAIATIGAFILGEFAEGVAVMLFYQIGETLQDMAVHRSRRSITALLDIRPDFATLKIGNHVQQVSPEAVKVGEHILVKPGEKIPLDGIIIEGTSTLDTSALTGESLPREVLAGDTVQSGSINQRGLLTIQTTTVFEESTVSKILDLVQNAANKKSNTENFITKFSRYYTPIVIAAAGMIAVIPPVFLHMGSLQSWVYKALIFLVISCPCALVISIPLGFFGGIGAASKNGILVKGSNYLDGLNDVGTIVFDKTGTLTKGVFEVVKIITEKDISAEEILKYAALAESHSNHPIARSILNAYEKKVDLQSIESYEEIPGRGMKVKVQGKEILCGNSKLLDSERIRYSDVKENGTTVYVALDKKWIGAVVIADAIKEDAPLAISKLKNIGIQNIVLLTGDQRSAAEWAGKKLGIDTVYAELLPHEKVEKLEILHRQNSVGKKVAFVGDGINDAPVIARADIGIAMGGLGSDAAIEASDIVFMTDEPSKIIDAIQISRKTRKIIWQNIILATGTKGIVLMMSILGLATMWGAVFADVGVALIAVLNAMRVLKK